MKKLFLSAILVLFVLGACKKFKIEPNVPSCIKNTAKEKTKSTTSAYASILEYGFQNQTVYVFDLDAGTTNARADIYNSNCEIIGYLGGVDGNRTVNGEDFSNAVFKRKVWPIKN